MGCEQLNVAFAVRGRGFGQLSVVLLSSTLGMAILRAEVTLSFCQVSPWSPLASGLRLRSNCYAFV